MTFRSKTALTAHVQSLVLPAFNKSMRGKRGGAARRRAREVKEQEVEELCSIGWDNRDESANVIVERMKANYGFVEWLFFGWQIYQLIMQIVNLIKGRT